MRKRRKTEKRKRKKGRIVENSRKNDKGKSKQYAVNREFRKGEKKKERQKEWKQVKEIEAFRKSTKVERLPVRKESWKDIL